MEFLLQRVEDINQELKGKDDLLEIAQGQVKKAEELASRVNATVSMETATQPDSNKSPPAVSPLDVAISMQTAISDSSKSPPDVFQDMHINSNNHLPPLSLLPLPFCNSDIYDNEDANMGDSEADKQAEERRHSKAVWRGKFRQVEVGDNTFEDFNIEVQLSSDEMSNDELANSGQATKYKAKDITFDEDDEVVEENVVRPSYNQI
jgi:hypothetical protein